MSTRDPNRGSAGQPPASMLPKPSAKRKRAIAAARRRARGKLPAPTVKTSKTGTSMSIGPSHADQLGWQDQLIDVFGTTSGDFARAQLQMIGGAIAPPGGDASQEDLNAALALVAGVAPANEVEGALAAQIASTHVIAMRFLKKAGLADSSQTRDSFVNGATKLQRTMTAQIEALASIRRGGKQQVVVKHVHVHQGPGGQAVIGDVHHAGGSRGQIENGRQGHAAITAEALAIAGGETLRSEDEGGNPMPVACSPG